MKRESIREKSTPRGSGAIRVDTLEGLPEAAVTFLERIREHKVIAFYGEMGSGKTTFIKALCSQLGVEEEVTSPTFNLVNEYLDREGDSIYHFDFYRINSLREAYDIGLEEYLYSGSLLFIEWPEKIEPLLPPDSLSISIEEVGDGARVISFI